MKLKLYILVTLTIIQQTWCHHRIEENNELFINWIYKQNKLNQYAENAREKRQIFRRQIGNGFGNNFGFSNNRNDEDDWYVFDVVEETPTTRRSFTPTQPQRSRTQFRQDIQPPQTRTPFRPSTQPPQTTAKVQIPNAGGPRPSRCEETCNSRTTAQYDPICGDDGQTYFNGGRIQCAQNCGRSVNLIHIGRCAPFG